MSILTSLALTLASLAPGLDISQQYARHLAENGFTVLVPTLISREYAARNGRAKMTSREFLYRSSFILGRHLIGYEVQKILALVDWCSSRSGDDASIGVIGWGEGGLLSLYSAALDERIEVSLGEAGGDDSVTLQTLNANE